MKTQTKPEPPNVNIHFASIVQKLLKERGVTQAKMFGVPGLKIGRKMFVMWMKGELVLKLPKELVDTLVASKRGKHFYHLFDKSRLMKEWVSIGHKNKRRNISIFKFSFYMKFVLSFKKRNSYKS